jgi:tRNAThr (cytosine32-N3)-methyltransferase
VADGLALQTLFSLFLSLSFKDRFLTEDQDVWSHNAWDRVPPPDDQDEIVATAMAKQRSLPVPEEEKTKINAKPSRNWYLSWLGIR